jgi:hypothetical protein
MASRRIEITAFRHRVIIASDNRELERSTDEIEMLDTDLQESVDLDSTEGQEILGETIRILEMQLKHRG